MSLVDAGAALFIVVGAARGAWVGALKEIAGMCATAASFVVVWFGAAPVARALEKPLEASYPIAYAFSALALGILASVLVRLAFWIPQHYLKKKEKDGASVLGMANRGGGGLLGAAKAAGWAWVVVSLIALAAGAGLTAKTTSEAASVRLCTRYNLVSMVFAGRLEQLRKDVDAAKRGASPELLKDPRVAALLKDDRLRKALEKGDFSVLTGSSAGLSLLTDPK